MGFAKDFVENISFIAPNDINLTNQCECVKYLTETI